MEKPAIPKWVRVALTVGSIPFFTVAFHEWQEYQAAMDSFPQIVDERGHTLPVEQVMSVLDQYEEALHLRKLALICFGIGALCHVVCFVTKVKSHNQQTVNEHQ